MRAPATKGRAVSHQFSRPNREFFPTRSGRYRRNQGLYGHTTVTRDDVERAAQRENPLAHADEPEAELLAGLHAAAIVADPHPGTAAAVACRLRPRLDDDVNRGRAGVAEHVGERLLHDAVDGEVGGLPGDAKRRRDHGLDGDIGMRLPPQPRQRFQRLAQAELGKADGPEALQHAAIELLKRVDLLQHGTAVFSYGLRIRGASVRLLCQRARMRAQREQIWPELVMELAGDLLALDILERYRSLGEAPLVLDGVTE